MCEVYNTALVSKSASATIGRDGCNQNDTTRDNIVIPSAGREESAFSAAPSKLQIPRCARNDNLISE
jgi:hypothetical protein